MLPTTYPGAHAREPTAYARETPPGGARVTRSLPISLPSGLWWTGALLGVLIGGAVAAPLGYLAAGLAALVLGASLVRATVRSELVVAAYWLAFTLFSTMLRGAVIDGMFYPFYIALVLGAVLGLVFGGLRFDRRLAWVYVAFLVVIVLSLVGYRESLGAATLERLIVFPFGALVLLQFRSRRGVDVVAWSVVASALAVSAWVIVSAVRGDFAYRGNIDVNENVVSFYVALGFVVAIAERLHARRRDVPRAVAAGVFAGLGVMAYALVLLASRGMILAVAFAVVALAARAARFDARGLGFLASLALLAVVGLLLPGGQGILERFEDPSTASGGGRIEIWARIGEGLAAAGPGDLALGHGFDASRELVARSFASLTSTHNAYLLMVYDFGVVGLVLFLALHVFVLARSWRVPGRHGAMMLALVAFLLASNVFMSTPDNFLYWSALGFALAAATWSVPGAAPPGPDR